VTGGPELEGFSILVSRWAQAGNIPSRTHATLLGLDRGLEDWQFGLGDLYNWLTGLDTRQLLAAMTGGPRDQPSQLLDAMI
jgi:hypothetical protein